MNFKFVRHKVTIGAMMGILVFGSQGILSEAAEIEEAPTSIETEDETDSVEENNIEESAVYGEFSFGTMDGYTYIYGEPSDEGDWIGKLYEDNKVTILSIEGTWAEIESGSVHGYVEIEYLLTEEAAIIRSQELAIKWVIVEASRLNVRTGPSTDYEIIDVVDMGTELLVVGDTQDGWQTVQLGDEICYVSGDYVTEDIEYSYAESREEEEQRLEEYEKALLGENEEEAVATSAVSVVANTDSSYEYASSDGQSVVDYALQFVGNPYVWGGTDLVNGADCSGFVQSVYAYFGISLPRTSYDQRTAGVEVSYSEIQVGDIICYEGHVGIYIGDGQIVNAIGSKYGIGISSATYTNIITIRRVI